METEKYSYEITEDKKKCYIWRKGEMFDRLIGSVTIDKTNAWTPHYQDGVTYLPINSALKLMDYEACKDVEIE